jgi:hypothetical protein
LLEGADNEQREALVRVLAPQPQHSNNKYVSVFNYNNKTVRKLDSVAGSLRYIEMYKENNGRVRDE